MKSNLFILILFFCLGCKNEQTTTKQIYYGCSNEKEKIVLVDASKFGNFKTLYQKVEQIACNVVYLHSKSVRQIELLF